VDGDFAHAEAAADYRFRERAATTVTKRGGANYPSSRWVLKPEEVLLPVAAVLLVDEGEIALVVGNPIDYVGMSVAGGVDLAVILTTSSEFFTESGCIDVMRCA
jgi:hypothetical protein